MTFTPAYYEWHLLDDHGNIIFPLEDPEWIYDCKSKDNIHYHLACLVDYLYMEEYDNDDYDIFLYGLTDEQRDEAIELMTETLNRHYLEPMASGDA